ncbi:2Fe-2S iron-sulfur cluster-binding protein [Algoriphagus formosus]|uniref:(2Fe-2S)-binding protein n=1 Tax=Algoriphagus formosus TaxID=2007308 RepID=A0A4R5V3D1_9BACT|nr:MULTISPECIES: 2Fe-2S iron-sulfur cluster-binding protein [Algoriphagus]TDK46005.1 (2Fe-2S)-binding protein [Algoriphagus aquimaris]
MSRIVIENLYNRTLDSGNRSGKVIELIHENGIDWMHACGKKGRCTSCKMIVVSGMENLDAPNERELFYKKQGRLKEDERLCCQTEIPEGDLRIRVAEINKFPHLDYSE